MTDSDYGPWEVMATVSRDRRSIEIAQQSLPPRTGDLARRRRNTIAERRYYVYFDVGRWGGNQRQFGLVYGDGNHSEFLLCAFHPSGGRGRVRTFFDVVDRLLNGHDFRGHIEILKRHLFSTLGLNTQGKIYVLIGDLHLPLIDQYTPASEISAIRERLVGAAAAAVDASLPTADLMTEASRMGWVLVAGPLGPLISSGGQVSDARWRQLYCSGDIFGAAGGSLYRLVAGLQMHCQDYRRWCGHWRRPQIHLVQVGDMYEHWIGLMRLFRDTQSYQVYLNSPASDLADIRHWINRTNLSNTFRISASQSVCLPDALHNCTVDAKTWIYGNHENYLRALSRARRISGDPPRRRMSLWDNNLFVEHGHMGDGYNRDGAAMGHTITQLVFLRGYIRSFDPDRREDFLRYATYKWANHRRQGKDTKVFVMAHTHKAYLAPVYVSGPGLT